MSTFTESLIEYVSDHARHLDAMVPEDQTGHMVCAVCSFCEGGCPA